jgi:hypothetical protein
MRVSIYARYSSDLQRAASIEDQVLVCTERVVREKWTLAATYTDRGISGASHLFLENDGARCSPITHARIVPVMNIAFGEPTAESMPMPRPRR